MIAIQSSYKPAAATINKIEIKGNDDTINGIYYYHVDDQERQSLSDLMRESLGLSTE
jgi:anionic cell wall polymer biosynthesis LytR-Cps2A-Psr (LCP) family protein